MQQPLRLLNNVQKARLLHSLLIQEIPDFLGYLNELTETVLNNKERIKAEWKDQMFGVDFWFELAEQVQRVMAKYPKDLYKSSGVFADQLFDGYTAIFTAHALTQFVALGKHTDPKFKQAVELYLTKSFMETAVLKVRFDALLAEYELQKEIERLYQKAVDSGALNITGETDGDYRMAKVIWYAILLKLQQDAMPFHPDNRKEAENLTLFL